jgi:hypothetical protein
MSRGGRIAILAILVLVLAAMIATTVLPPA